VSDNGESFFKDPEYNRATGRPLRGDEYKDRLVSNPVLRAQGVTYGKSYFDSEVLGPQLERPFEDEA
jgi:hypothetical protein